MTECADNSCSIDCVEEVHLKCSCPKKNKIPAKELFYLFSERKREKGKSQILLWEDMIK